MSDWKVILVVIITAIAGAVASRIVNQLVLMVPGIVLMIVGWYVFAQALKEKIEFLKEAWVGISRARELEVALIHKPQERERIERELERLRVKLREQIKKLDEKFASLKKNVITAFIMYGLGAGLLAGALGGVCKGFCSYVITMIFLLLLMSPVPTMLGEMRRLRV